jgi:hypothetical protein
VKYLFLLVIASCSSTVGGGKFEFEDLGEKGDWKKGDSISGYKGSGYMCWEGPNLFAVPGKGKLSYEWYDYKSREYKLKIRSYNNNPVSDMSNDVWVRVNDAEWLKIFSSTKNKWTTDTKLDRKHKISKFEFDSKIGKNEIEFSGRSNGFCIDQVELDD